MKLYLDDRRTPPYGEDCRSADNYADFLALLDKYRDELELVDLDFDLGYDSFFTGFDVLKYMKRHGMSPVQINVHSTHAPGRAKMLGYAKVSFRDSLITVWF